MYQLGRDSSQPKENTVDAAADVLADEVQQVVTVKKLAVVVVVAAAMIPVAVLSHELGHLSGYFAFGFPSPVLHYGSSSFEGESEFWGALRDGDTAAANARVDVRAAGLCAAFGLLVSYITIGLGLLAFRRFGDMSALCLAVAAAARFPLILVLALLGRAEHTDEAHVAQALGLPFLALVMLAVAALCLATIGSYRILPAANRGKLLAAILVGAAIGTITWLGLVGPLVLP